MGLLLKAKAGQELIPRDQTYTLEGRLVMGLKSSAPRMFYQLDFENMVPQDHLLRLVSAHVDLSFVRGLVRDTYAENGRPSTDPVVLFKISLIGFLYGIRSERRLASEIQLNLAYRWFLGYDFDEATPEHTALTKARARFGQKVYEEFFQGILVQCRDHDLIRGETLCIDSTLLDSSSPYFSVVDRPVEHQIPENASDYTSGVWRENAEVPVEPPTDAPGVASPEPDASAERPKESSRRKRPGTNERRVSTTDPDASVVAYKSHRTPRLAYKIHGAVDSGNHRIVAAVVTTTGSVADASMIPNLLERHQTTVGTRPEFASADKGYGVVEVYEYLKGIGVAAAIRPRRTWRSARERRKVAGFRYDDQRGVFVCPTGRTLHRFKEGPDGRVMYRVGRSACAGCPNHGSVCTAQRPSINRSPKTDILEDAEAQSQTPEIREVLRLRKAWTETIWGDMKTNRGLHRAKLKGLSNVSIDALMALVSRNVRSLAKSLM